MIRLRMAGVAVATGLLAGSVAGCGRTTEATAEATAGPVRDDAPVSAPVTPAVTPVTPSPDASGPATVPEALRFTATTLGGDRFSGESLAGRPVVFWFWAPWCPKCMYEAPAVRAAAGKYGDVAFVGVAGLDGEAAMKNFVRQTRTDSLVHLSDEKGVVWTRLGISQQSTFVFMRPDGSTWKASGPLRPEELNRHVENLLAG